MEEIKESDEVVIWLAPGRSYLVKVKKGASFSTLKGMIKFDDLIGKKFGEKVITSLNYPVYIFKPNIRDRLKKLSRKTQIMYPKDIGYAILMTGISSGSIVIEAGCGSGAMTICLANAVRPEGKVFSYDINEGFITLAKENLSKAGLGQFVEFIKKDLYQEGFDQKDVDAIFIDLPEPWRCVRAACESLKPCGTLVSISPTYNQVERFVKEVSSYKFAQIRTVEILEREILAREGRTRPKERMISHTGFLTFARKVI